MSPRPGPPPLARPKQLLRAFYELKARMGCGLDRELCLTQIGAFTRSGEPGIGISQIGARVFELSSDELGCKIESRLLPGHHMHTYFLRSYPPDIIDRIHKYRAKRKPQQEKLPLTESAPQIASSSADWYEREHGPRPSEHPKKNEVILPLFDVVR